MGEVWKARDTRLDRIVAIKISKAQFSERFEREARVIASLNHPHICTLYDVGPNYLVMEYIEGAPVVSQKKPAPLPLDQALRYAVQIADALVTAHNKPVIHRDLKPANILVNKAGVKVLDFGLAKFVPVVKAGDDATKTMGLTVKGQILGTLYYMAPETLQGEEAGARSDLFSFGLVLYEMLTGKRAFEGSTPASVIAAILERPAPSINGVAPPALDRVLQRCLAKDPDDRWQTARDLKAELEWIAATLEPGTSAPAPARKSGWLAWGVAAVAILSLAALGLMHFRETPPASPPVSRFEIAPAVQVASGASFGLSPDGRQLAFAVADSDGANRIWIRSMDSLEAKPLRGAEYSRTPTPPFWSPDSRSLAFDAGGTLKKIDISGGPPQTLCDVPSSNAVGGSWNRDGTILFGSTSGPLMRVAADGGPAVALTAIDHTRKETRHAYPVFLPDGSHFLYLRSSGVSENEGIYIGSLDAKPAEQSTRLLVSTAWGAEYVPGSGSGPGELLFLRAGTLMAQPFDDRRLTLAGDAVPVASEVGSYLGFGFFSTSRNGVLAYRNGSAEEFDLGWRDRQGKFLGSAGERGTYFSVAIAPDETRAAIARADLQLGTSRNLWLLDLARGSATRFTTGLPFVDSPVWSPDGRQIAFTPARDGIYRKPANGSQEMETLLRSSGNEVPTSWSHDGRFLLYTALAQKTGHDIWALPLGGDRKPVRFVATEFDETGGQFSPDGRWVAYASDESGRREIYVRAFPDTGEKWIVSRDGGGDPRWPAKGKELFYIAPDGKMMGVEIAGDPRQASAPQSLFPTPAGYRGWDVTADGKRFLFAAPVAKNAQAPFTVVLNWQAELKK